MPELETLAAASQGEVSYLQDNQTMWGYYNIIPSTGWIIFTEVDRQEVLSPIVAHIGIYFLGIMLLAIILGTLQSKIFGKRFAEPLLRLGNRIADITQGKAGDDSGYSFSNQEIATIADNIEQLALQSLRQKEKELKKTEEALKESEKQEKELSQSLENMQELDRLKTNFISSVSHELRTPLTSISGFTNIISKRFVEVIYPALELEDKKIQRVVRQVQGNLEIIHGEVEKLKHLINQILDIAMLETGRLEWQKVPLQINRIIEKVAEDNREAIQKKGLTLTMDLPGDLPEVWGDEERLNQLFSHLITNGIKFTDRGGIKISAFSTPEKKILITINDTGKGINPEEQKTIFDKFSQLGDVLTDKPSGTGLGLSICKEIVEKHGGEIWLESQPREGSTFFVKLPLGA